MVSQYENEIEKFISKYKSKNAFYSSEEYKREYPRLSALYKSEGLGVKRKNLLRNRRRLNQIGMEAMFAVK